MNISSPEQSSIEFTFFIDSFAVSKTSLFSLFITFDEASLFKSGFIISDEENIVDKSVKEDFSSFSSEGI